MDLQQYSDKIKMLIQASREKAIERIIVPPANKLLATVKNRIQKDGKNTNGSNIGSYSTEPMYASVEQFDKKSAFKPGVKAFAAESQKISISPKTNKIRKGKIATAIVKERMKTMYLVDGYSQLRAIQGKPVDKVNLTYSGDLMLSYQQHVKEKEIVQGLISEFESLKRQGLEKKYGKVLSPQKSEIEQYKKEVAEIQKQKCLSYLEMFKAAIENIKNQILEANSYFQNGFCNVYQNEDVGIVISGDKPVFPATEFGNYFYLRLPKNVTFSNGGLYSISDNIKGIGLNADIILVAGVINSDEDILLKNLINTIQAICDETIVFTSAIYNANEIIKQELAFMKEESRSKALANIPNNLSLVSIQFTYSIPFSFSNCINNPCSC